MILLDSSVLIDFLVKPSAALLKQFQVRKPAICGICIAEVLHGAEDLRHVKKLRKILLQFPQIEIPENLWPEVGKLLFRLRQQGVTVPFPDAVLAALALRRNIPLWSRDLHFDLVKKHWPRLKLFQETT